MLYVRSGSKNGLDALKMRCPLFSRKPTCIGRRPKVGFSDLIPNFLRMNQAHRSAPSSRKRFDHPRPHPQKTTLSVGPLAASVRTKASVTSGALKAKLANLTSKCLCPLFRTKVSRITGRTSTLHVVDQACLSAVCANYRGHALRIHGVLDSYYGYL